MMTTHTGSEYATQVPFGCATPRVPAVGSASWVTCYGSRSDQVSLDYLRALAHRSDQVSLDYLRALAQRSAQVVGVALPLAAWQGLAVVRNAVGGPLGGGGAKPVPASGQLWPVVSG